MNRFDNAVAALVKGYNEGTLRACDCTKCAVGNIIVHNNSFSFIRDEDPDHHNSWYDGEGNTVKATWFPLRNVYEDDEQVVSTGYSVEELVDIEGTFEYVMVINRSLKEEEAQYNAMMAVVDLLMRLEEKAGNLVESPKEQFNKPELVEA